MSSQTLWFDGAGLTLESTTRPDAEFTAHIGQVRFGDRYRRCNVADQLARFYRPRFLSLRDNGQLVAAMVLDEQTLQWHGKRVEGFYRGLLSVAPEVARQGYGRTLAKQAMAWLDRRGAARDIPVFSYGCIDAGNERAWQLLDSLGAYPVGTLTTQIKYRQRSGVPILDVAVTDALTDAAADAWRETNTEATLRPSSVPRDHWITVEDTAGGVAACRHRLTSLDLTPQGGLTGFVTERLMLLFPPGRKRFNPGRFRYVSVSDVVATRDSAHLWRRLIPHLMALHDTHFVAITADTASPDVQRLVAAGVLSGFGREVRVVGKWHGGQAPAEGEGHLAVAAPDL
ncbi:MAG: GNAT family N-acetyltransferase [Pseudomonadota bacterium]